MNWIAWIDIVSVPIAFVLGRYSKRFQFIRVKRRYKQNVSEFIRGR